MSDTIKESIRILLAEAIDYAGLFPPSRLSMAEAVINYATYKNSNYTWMLGRFVCPIDRLGEFVENGKELFSGGNGDVWRLTVLGSGSIEQTIDLIGEFNAENEGKAIIDMLELKTDSSAQIEAAASRIPDELTSYFELPINEDLPELVSTLAITKQRAKIRAGGIRADLFPTSRELMRFVRTCSAANIPFKATAGLHHPVRCFKALTYEPHSPKGAMHGFLNLFLATGFAREGYRPEILEEIMEDEFEEVFGFDENGAFWQKEHFLNNYQLETLRAKGINSFGSCSFDEPISDLQELGIL